MKTEQLRKKDKKELQKILLQEKEKLRNLRFDLAAGKLKNHRQIPEKRREIARILTLIKEGREL